MLFTRNFLCRVKRHELDVIVILYTGCFVLEYGYVIFSFSENKAEMCFVGNVCMGGLQLY